MRSGSSSVAALALLLALGAGVAAARDTAPRASVDSGRKIAAQECARCHAIDIRGDSPRPTAPPFREIRKRYSAAALAGEFEAISAVGHYEMQPKPISKSDGEALIAYIQSLGG